MIDDLEETLREELSARAGKLPAPPGLADIVIGRARRVRRRRKVAAAALSCLLVLGGVTGWAATTLDWGHGEDAAVLADAAAELGEFSVLSPDGDILTGAGDLYSSELAVADAAVEVHGGWVVTGRTAEDSSDTVARYVGFDGQNTDLGGGDEVLVHTSERGDAVAVETIGSAGTGAEVFVVTSDSEVYSRGRVDMPLGVRIGGMTNTAVWMDNLGGRDETLDMGVPIAETWLWTFSGSVTFMQVETMPKDMRLLASIATNRVLVTVPGTDPDDLCLATATVADQIYVNSAPACFSDLSLLDVVVGPDGHQVLGYVQPAVPTDDDPGEWVWLPTDEGASLIQTGFIDFETKPFFTYHDLAFYDPEGTWYDLEGMKLGIPPLDGRPIPIKHVPSRE